MIEYLYNKIVFNAYNQKKNSINYYELILQNEIRYLYKLLSEGVCRMIGWIKEQWPCTQFYKFNVEYVWLKIYCLYL